MTELQPTAILAEGTFEDSGHSKTAYGILRYAPQSVVAVIDSHHAGRDSAAVSGLGPGIPVVAGLDQALALGARRLVIGVAPAGGGLPPDWRPLLRMALERGLELVSGLHLMLAEDPELAAAAARGGGGIIDLRRVPEGLVVAECRAQTVAARVILTVGTDCNTGKMTTALELVRAARERGLRAAFSATGQTGIAIAGRGIAIDHVVSDFTAGAAERLVLEAAAEGDPELIVVEGQGGLAQPVYSGVTLSLLHGSLPDGMVLCHRQGQDLTEIVDLPLPPLDEQVRLYEGAMRPVKPSRVLAISLNTRGLDEAAATRAVREAEALTGLPATDPVRWGAVSLLEAILRELPSKLPLRGSRGKIDSAR